MRPYRPGQQAERRQDSLQALAQSAPGYAGLLNSYGTARLQSASHKNRNVHLYGLVAEQLGTQIALDKALFGALTKQVPRLTQAHYIDAVLADKLSGLQPFGTDPRKMEAEKDLVWSLAQNGAGYREYILSDRDAQALPEQRPVCKLSADVNARFDRMIDIMKTMPGQLAVKPFEIVSACLAQYLEVLEGERPGLTTFFEQHVVTTVQ